MNQMLENRYRIIKDLGDGGFGKTYVAEDTHMPSLRCSVIKQLKPINKGSEIYQIVQDRFLREAAILEQLGGGSNQIPSLYAYFESNGQFYLVQEYIEGDTLSKKLRTQGKLSSDVVKDILIKILPVLDYVHNKGIVHRDIKPENIIIRNADNLPVLIDFGAVKETMQTIVSEADTLRSSIMTGKSSIVIGTPGFMSSEQLSGRPVFSSDLYALGMTAIYLLTGKMPQELDSDPRTGEVIWKEHAPDVNPELANVLDRAIQSHLRDRFSTANEMLNALQSETIATTVIAPPLPVAATVPPSNQASTVISHQENNIVSSNVEKKKGSKAPVIIALVSALLLGGVGAFAFSMMNQQQVVQQRLASIEEERQKAAESRQEENEQNTKKEQELQRQLEEEKRLRQEAENRRFEQRRVENAAVREPETDSNSNSGSNSNSNSFPEGTFANSEWSLNLSRSDNNIFYQAKSLKDSSSLNLENGRISGSDERKIYTWNNGAYRYQVVWQPNDADYVRLRVFTPSGELLNQLLSKS
ncbi:serine/threonine protein kinase [Calothrix parasitica NIES-267]|uniref:non-specific serine/threonine protein kinase n=1 Tax=Calothrix parasitica NIES-267 TaxID=1973488 RepID=A0A1Z4LZV1_9CYAN|nr:serine/threonine protein kinase [Calothrix parasitica NIES-267]